MLNLRVHRPSSFAAVYSILLGIMHVGLCNKLVRSGAKWVLLDTGNWIYFIPVCVGVVFGVVSLVFWFIGFWYIVKGINSVNRIVFGISVPVVFTVAYSLLMLLGYWTRMVHLD